MTARAKDDGTLAAEPVAQPDAVQGAEEAAQRVNRYHGALDLCVVCLDRTCCCGGVDIRERRDPRWKGEQAASYAIVVAKPGRRVLAPIGRQERSRDIWPCRLTRCRLA